MSTLTMICLDFSRLVRRDATTEERDGSLRLFGVLRNLRERNVVDALEVEGKVRERGDLGRTASLLPVVLNGLLMGV